MGKVAWWCNGSTGVFGTLSRGSNPCRAATLNKGRVSNLAEITSPWVNQMD